MGPAKGVPGALSDTQALCAVFGLRTSQLNSEATSAPEPQWLGAGEPECTKPRVRSLPAHLSTETNKAVRPRPHSEGTPRGPTACTGTPPEHRTHGHSR